VNRPTAPTGQNLALGIALIVAAFFCVAVMSAFGKAAAAMPTAVIGFFQSFISLLVFLPWVLRRGLRELRTSRLPLHVVRALAGLASQVLYFWAVKQMSLVDAVLLVNAAPLFIPVIALLWQRTPITGAVLASLLIGFVGVALIIRPGPELLANPSSLIALSAALFSAIALVTVNTLSRTDRPDTILFYYFFIASLATLPFATAQWTTPTTAQWGWLAGIGVFMALAQLLIILAYQHATASQIAPFNYSVVVFSGLIGWIAWHDVLGPIALLGILLVSAGGIASIVLARPRPAGHAFWLSHGHGGQALPPALSST
jgi:drug/metabolite transporter (DMT)-like permease